MVEGDLEAFQGEDYLQPFDVTDTDVDDITDWTILFTLKATLTGQVLVQEACAVTDGPAKRFALALTSAQLTRAEAFYLYDIWRTNAGAQVPLRKGRFHVKKPVRTIVGAP